MIPLIRFLFALLAALILPSQAYADGTWKAGVARAVITPDKPQWLAGYADRRKPSEGMRHDLWVKALALEDRRGHKAVIVTCDLVGTSRSTYEKLCLFCKQHFGIDRSRVLISVSHTHCGPATAGFLEDFYPVDESQRRLMAEYTAELDRRILQTVEQAFGHLESVQLSAGQGLAAFAVNRRNNKEPDVPRLAAEGVLKGPVDHAVPVLAVYNKTGRLLAVAFGYACHATTLNDFLWCGDYPGYAQIALEKRFPGATALFWAGCGGDQNPLPRRKVALAEAYGERLAAAVEKTLVSGMRPVEPELVTAVETIRIPYDRVVNRADLEKDSQSGASYRAQWARRMLAELDRGTKFASSYPYTVQAWRIGNDQLWISMGGETVVDYALRFKQPYGEGTWIAGYAHETVAYIPSHRVWKEGGYEAETILEYGHPAYKWAEDVEERVTAAVDRVARKVLRHNNETWQ